MSLSSRRRILIASPIAVALLGVAVFYLRGVEAPASAGGDTVLRADAPRGQPAQAGAPAASVKPHLTNQTTASHNPVEGPDRLAERIASVASSYQDLVKRAKAGDADAALSLFSALRSCADAPRTQAAMDDRLKQAAIDHPGGSPEYLQAAKFVNEQFEQCAKFSDQQINDWRKWLTMAANNGDGAARKIYIAFAKPDDPKSDTYFQDTRDYVTRSRRYLGEALAAGDPQALLVTSNNYADYGNGIYDPDPVQQYAYLYAYCLATECKNVTFNLLQKVGAGLSPQDLSNATSQGQAIYKKCCAK